MPRRGQIAAPRDVGATAVLIVVGTVIVASSCADLAVTVARWWRGGPWQWRNPVAILFDLGTGAVAWSGSATFFFVSELVVVGMLTVTVASLASRHWSKSVDKRDWDRAARLMGTRRDERAIQNANERSTTDPDEGVLCGRSLRSGRLVMVSSDHLHLDIWGGGRDAAAARICPAILRAQGAVLTTTSSASVIATTRSLREKLGNVWVFDPQEIADGAATWWWNPLAGIHSVADAEELADQFADARLDDDERDREDTVIGPKARRLLALALYAAAVSRRPIADVYRWITDPTDATMKTLLDEVEDDQVGAGSSALQRLPDALRDSVYATAERYVDWLADSRLAQWVTGASGSFRLDLKPEEFVRTRDTLYLVARKGHGSAVPLTTALTAATLRAAEAHANDQGGMVHPPMIAALDDVANTCRWSRLPEIYDLYRSRGIVLMTFLRSWSQGVQLWGYEGMRAFWNAASVKVYGGGSGEPEFLRMISEVVGDWEMPQRAAFSNMESLWTWSSWQDSTRPKAILPVADLAALPDGVLVAMVEGMRPLLLAAAFGQGRSEPDIAKHVELDAATTAEEPVSLMQWLRRRVS